MKHRIFTVPNQLTFLRLAFLPFFIAIKYDRYPLALAILLAAGISDGLDGWLARGLNQKTPLGAYLDPIADKLLLSTSSFVLLAWKGEIAWWLTILVMGRDVLLLVACAAILITVGYRAFPPSVFGKANTFFQILLVVLVLLLTVWDDHALLILREVCGYCVAAFS